MTRADIGVCVDKERRAMQEDSSPSTVEISFFGVPLLGRVVADKTIRAVQRCECEDIKEGASFIAYASTACWLRLDNPSVSGLSGTALLCFNASSILSKFKVPCIFLNAFM